MQVWGERPDARSTGRPERGHGRGAVGRLLCRRGARHRHRLRDARHPQPVASGLRRRGRLRGVAAEQPARAGSGAGRARHGAALLRAGGASLPALSRLLRAPRRRRLARPGVLLRHTVHHRGRAGAHCRRRLPLGGGALHRRQPHLWRHHPAGADAGALLRLDRHDRAVASVPDAQLHRPGDPGGLAGPCGLALDGREPDPDRAGRAQHRPRLHRPRLRGRGAGRHGQLLRHAAGQHHPRHHRKHRLGHVEPVVGAGDRLRLSAADACLPFQRPAGAQAVSKAWFWAFGGMLVLALWLAGRLVTNEYVFFMGYAVAQYVLLATAWNLLGGYAGYINFGTAAFFALGAYVSVAINKLVAVPLPVLILAGAVAAGAVGLAMGYLTLKLRGVFFSIATLALAIVAQAAVTNWEFVGGASGAYLLRPSEGPWGGSYVEYLFYVMLAMAVAAVALARTIERSTVGLGLSAIRDDELVAEAYGVPTLRLKLLVTVLSGALMGMAGAPLPFYVAYLDPPSAFNLSYAVNTIAMPLIGGTSSWIGPVVGAVLLTMVQQTAMVTISSAFNLMLVGLLMVTFISLAPNGIVGLVRNLRRRT